MQFSRFQKIVLGISGFTAFAIGCFILLSPLAFYSGYGISLEQDASLLSELRAPGAGLAAFGVIMLLGLFRKAIAPVSIVVALTVYLAFPIGRIVGMVMDGIPSGSVLGALLVEIVVACLLLAAFGRNRLRVPATERFLNVAS
ncbi:MAG: DUF4345 domain-containing protein [Granulosicoccus sp.]